MSQLSLGFEVLYAGRLTVRYLVTSELPCYKAFAKVTALRYLVAGHAQCQVWRHGRRTVRGPPRSPHFSMAIISVTVQLWI